jgi:PAS domain S-box-containing protein
MAHPLRQHLSLRRLVARGDNRTKAWRPARKDFLWNFIIWLTGGLVSLIGVLALLGYLLNLPLLVRTLPYADVVTSFPSAVGLSVLGLASSVLIDAWRHPERLRTQWHPWLLRASLMALFFTFSLGLFFCIRYLIVADFRLSSIFLELWDPSLPSFLSSLHFMLIPLAVYLLYKKPGDSKATHYGVGIISLFVWDLSLFSLAGFWFSIPFLHSYVQSLPSIVCFLLLSVLLLAAPLPQQGLLSPLCSTRWKIRLLSVLGLLSPIGILVLGIVTISKIYTLLPPDETILLPVQELFVAFEFATVLLAVSAKTLSFQALYLYNKSLNSEEAILQEFEFKETLMNNLGEGVCAIDQSGSITYINPAACEVLGWEADALIGQRIETTFCKAHQSVRPTILGQLLSSANFYRTPQPVRVSEDVFSRKDGSCFLVSWSLSPIPPGKSSTLEGSILSFSDISEQKQQQQQFYTTFEQAAIGIAQLDLEGSWIRVNQKFCKILDRPEAEVLAMPFSSLFTSEDPHTPQDFSTLGALLLQGKLSQQVWDAQVVSPSGETRWITLTMSIVRDFQQHPQYFTLFIEDVTERKAAESSLANLARDLEERVQQRTQELTLTKEQSEIANQQKTRVLAMVSHDFKNPLNAIIGYSDMLEAGMGGALNEKQQKYVHNIALGSKHLLSMVTSILDTARSTGGQLTLQPSWFSVASFLEEIMPLALAMAEKKNVSLFIEKDPELQGMWADPLHFRQIILNLLSNAIKYNKKGGQVWCRIYPKTTPPCVFWEITDTGIGIAPDKIPALFTDYFRIADATARLQEEGSGLGLSFVKQLIELHGGTITVESVPEEGSTFTVCIPQKLPPSEGL